LDPVGRDFRPVWTLLVEIFDFSTLFGAISTLLDPVGRDFRPVWTLLVEIFDFTTLFGAIFTDNTATTDSTGDF
jgi:hypothetical protein